MTKRNIHTVYNSGKEMWETKREKQEKPLASSHTKTTAEGKSVREAKKAGVEHVIHNRDGKISDKDSYGRDPMPPKDKKH
jgi:hypothetical protein